jgi:hypothetical protein
MPKLTKIENYIDLHENWYTVILHADHGTNKENILKEKLTSMGGH